MKPLLRDLLTVIGLAWMVQGTVFIVFGVGFPGTEWMILFGLIGFIAAWWLGLLDPPR